MAKTTTSDQANLCHILTIYEPSQTREILLDRLTYSIGRDSQNGIKIDNRGISRQHALLFRLPSPIPGAYLYRLVDGNSEGQLSRNGLMVNGIRIRERDLKSGDQIVFGSVISAEYKTIQVPAGESSAAFSAQSLAYKSMKSPIQDAQKTLVNLSLLDFGIDSLEELEQEMMTVGLPGHRG
jgi:pSer/pThr/pTyr-binding forkhead associated (FHA) protein